MEIENIIMSEILSENEDGTEQIRMTVNEFREVQYLHIRKYYLDFDESWQPTPKGIAIPITITSIVNMFNALAKLLAKSDVLHIILENCSDPIKELVYEALSESIDGKG